MDFKGSSETTGDSSGVGVGAVVDVGDSSTVVGGDSSTVVGGDSSTVRDFVLFFLVPFGFFFFFKYFVLHCGLFFLVTNLQGCLHVFFRGTT
jgi:hypothetical protein